MKVISSAGARAMVDAYTAWAEDARTLLYVIAILLVLGLLLVQPDVMMALHMAFGP
jgi:hypothetical protein